MRSFIYRNLRQFLGSSYAAQVLIYAFLCCFMAEVSYTQAGKLTTPDILAIYQSIILSVGLLNCIYPIVSHFRESLNSTNRDVLLLHLGLKRYFWGLIICYALSFIILFTAPLLLAAFVQQTFHQGRAPELVPYLIVIRNIFARVTLPVILLAILLIIWTKNTLLTLVSWLLFYGISAFLFLFLHVYQQNNTAVQEFPLKSAFFIGINAVAILAGMFISKRLTRFSYTEKVAGGIFSFAARKLKMFLAKYHYDMLGLKTQSLYLFFGVTGFVLIIGQLSAASVSTIVIAKMYCAVCIPVLFSLNQYHIVQADRESGMLPLLFLRQIAYKSILFNRWLCMLIAQIVIAGIFLVMLFLLYPEIGPGFLSFAVLLHVFFSSLNFFLALKVRHSGFANIFVAGMAYVLLREDIQVYLSNTPIGKAINVLACIASFNNHSPALLHFLLVLFLTAINMHYIKQSLKNSAAFLQPVVSGNE